MLRLDISGVERRRGTRARGGLVLCPPAKASWRLSRSSFCSSTRADTRTSRSVRVGFGSSLRAQRRGAGRDGQTACAIASSSRRDDPPWSDVLKPWYSRLGVQWSRQTPFFAFGSHESDRVSNPADETVSIVDETRHESLPAQPSRGEYRESPATSTPARLLRTDECAKLRTVPAGGGAGRNGRKMGREQTRRRFLARAGTAGLAAGAFLLLSRTSWTGRLFGGGSGKAAARGASDLAAVAPEALHWRSLSRASGRRGMSRRPASCARLEHPTGLVKCVLCPHEAIRRGTLPRARKRERTCTSYGRPPVTSTRSRRNPSSLSPGSSVSLGTAAPASLLLQNWSCPTARKTGCPGDHARRCRGDVSEAPIVAFIT
jgi:hypothetical protein